MPNPHTANQHDLDTPNDAKVHEVTSDIYRFTVLCQVRAYGIHTLVFISPWLKRAEQVVRTVVRNISLLIDITLSKHRNRPNHVWLQNGQCKYHNIILFRFHETLVRSIFASQPKNFICSSFIQSRHWGVHAILDNRTSDKEYFTPDRCAIYY